MAEDNRRAQVRLVILLVRVCVASIVANHNVRFHGKKARAKAELIFDAAIKVNDGSLLKRVYLIGYFELLFIV